MKMTYKIQYLLESNWELLISRHFSKGLFQFLGDCFELLLLSNKFILKPVNLLLQLLDRFVSKFCSCFCLLQFSSKSFDLFLVGLFTLVGFFFSSKILVSPTSALSSAFSRSCSHCTSFLETSSYVASAASAFSLASFSSFSKPAILLSSSTALFSKTFFARSESSAAVPALSSLVFAATSFSSVFSRSSSSPETLLLRAFISASAARSDFSFSSSCRLTMPSFSVVRSSSVSNCLALVASSETSSSAFSALSLATLLASSQTSHLSQALSFSTFMACIFFLIASIVRPL